MTIEFSRREFLQKAGGAALAVTVGSHVLDTVGPTARGAAADVVEATLAPGTPICVVVALDGGNDVLNTVVPVTDGWYYDDLHGRGSLAVRGAEALRLQGVDAWRLHPSLPWLKQRWADRSDVAIVLGVGNPHHLSFSHFDAMTFWQTGYAHLGERRGWMGRYADLVYNRTRLAVVATDEPRRDIVADRAVSLVVRDPAAFAIAPPPQSDPAFATALRAMSKSMYGAPSPITHGGRLLAQTMQVASRVQTAGSPAAGQANPIANRLLRVASLITSGLPVQTYLAQLNGFDTHMFQLSEHADRLRMLDDGLKCFFAALAGQPQEHDVFVVVTSEFGRQVKPNQAGGTDHGQAGAAVFIGPGVIRGIYGEAPTLDPGGPTAPNRIDDALAPTLDFRSVHATILNRLSADAGAAEAVLGGSYEDLGIFAA